MSFVLNYKGTLNNRDVEFYIPIKLLKATEEKADVRHFFYGSACCQDSITKEYNCVKCGKKTESVKVYPQGKPKETGTTDLWGIKEVAFEDIDLPRTYMFKWLEIGKVKKPKASEIEKMREYQELKAKLGDSSLQQLFYYLALKRKALLGNIVFKEGKKNEFFIKPHYLKKVNKATLLFGVLDGNKETKTPTEQYEIKVVEKAEEKEKEKKKEKEVVAE